MRPTREPSVRSDEIFPFYWNRTQNAFTPQDIAVKAEILNPTDVAQAHSLAAIAPLRARDERVGMWRPRALAVLRLMISSTLAACWTGRSADYRHSGALQIDFTRAKLFMSL
jgi:hypothetical protein